MISHRGQTESATKHKFLSMWGMRWYLGGWGRHILSPKCAQFHTPEKTVHRQVPHKRKKAAVDDTRNSEWTGRSPHAVWIPSLDARASVTGIAVVSCSCKGGTKGPRTSTQSHLCVCGEGGQASPWTTQERCTNKFLDSQRHHTTQERQHLSGKEMACHETGEEKENKKNRQSSNRKKESGCRTDLHKTRRPHCSSNGTCIRCVRVRC